MGFNLPPAERLESTEWETSAFADQATTAGSVLDVNPIKKQFKQCTNPSKKLDQFLKFRDILTQIYLRLLQNV